MSSCSSSCWSDVQNVQLRPEPPIRKKRIKSLLVNFYLFILWSWYFCLYKLYTYLNILTCKCFASSFVRINDNVIRYNRFRQFILTICQFFLYPNDPALRLLNEK